MPPESEPLLSVPPPPMLTGKRIAIYFIGFILAFGVLDTVLFTAGTSSLEMTEKGQAKMLAYNQATEQAQAQQSLGWKHRLVINRNIDNHLRVTLEMEDKNGNPLSMGGALVRFFLPANDGVDLDVTLQERSPGSYQAFAEFPQSGQWEAYIAVRVGQDVYRAHESVNIQ